MENLIFVFEKLFSDKNLAEGFSKCKSGDEMYNFCINIKDGYTRSEWENFIRIVYSLALEKGYDKTQLEEDLDKVCGGTMNSSVGKKFLSCSLALLGILPFSGLGSVKAATGEGNLNPQKTVSKERRSSILPLVFKGALVGIVVGAIGTYLYHKVNNSKSGGNVGISNLGNTCYMNSAIQQLYNLDHFRESVMNDNSGEPRVKAIKYLFSVMSGKEREDKKKLREAAGILGYKGKQEDCSEFIQKLDPIFEKYGMEKCLSNPFSVNPNLSGLSLQNILDHGGAMDYSAARELLRKKLHKGKEVSDEEINNHFDKLTEKENFNLGKPLAVNPVEGQFGILINRAVCDLYGNQIKSNLPIVISDKVKKHGKEYVLTGAAVHKGSSCDSGHYISYKKGTDGQWHIYNDSSVSKVNEKNVKSKSSTDGVLFIFTDVSKL